MQDNYPITRHDTGDNLITIKIHLNEDGGLTVEDWCCGTAAEAFFGHDDFESNVTLGRDAASKLFEGLTGVKPANPAQALARLLQSTKGGDTHLQTWLRGKCDELDIEYKWVTWP